jgi:hypothetical protein
MTEKQNEGGEVGDISLIADFSQSVDRRISEVFEFVNFNSLINFHDQRFSENKVKMILQKNSKLFFSLMVPLLQAKRRFGIRSPTLVLIF